MEGLEDDADIAAAKARQRVFVERTETFAGHRHGAAVGPFEPGHHHQKRRFSRARRADHSDRLAAAYIEVDTLEDMDACRALTER